MMKRAILVSSVAFAGAHALPGNLRHSAALVGTASTVETDLDANPSTHFGNLHPGVEKTMSNMDKSFETLDKKKADVQAEGLSTAAMTIQEVKAANSGVRIADKIHVLKASIASDENSIKKMKDDLATMQKAHEEALKKAEDGTAMDKVKKGIGQTSSSISLLSTQLEESHAARDKAAAALNKVQTLQKDLENANDDLLKAQSTYDEVEYQYRKVKIDSAQEVELSQSAARSAQASMSKLKQRASVVAEAQASVDGLKAALKSEEASTDKSYNNMMKEFNQKKIALLEKKKQAEAAIAKDREELAKVVDTRFKHAKLQSGARKDYQQAADDVSSAKENAYNEAGKKMAKARGGDYLKKNDWAWMQSLLQEKRQEKDAELRQEEEQTMSLQQQFEIAQAAKRATSKAKLEVVGASD
eukprot:TRINITY_DN64903_c0_g1_i1.p1 TRINITY_DN64903_c0_g1~~TRINITY_DN64903_c0_g1_i1.p1  ORF type:complete len:415 (+),score=142.11 TRINITY_DN64903_c0_g1_i1:123-1367(+)